LVLVLLNLGVLFSRTWLVISDESEVSIDNSKVKVTGPQIQININ